MISSDAAHSEYGLSRTFPGTDLARIWLSRRFMTGVLQQWDHSPLILKRQREREMRFSHHFLFGSRNLKTTQRESFIHGPHGPTLTGPCVTTGGAQSTEPLCVLYSTLSHHFLLSVGTCTFVLKVTKLKLKKYSDYSFLVSKCNSATV